MQSLFIFLATMHISSSDSNNDLGCNDAYPNIHSIL